MHLYEFVAVQIFIASLKKKKINESYKNVHRNVIVYSYDRFGPQT